MDPMVILTIFILSVFVGFEVVSKVSTTLHTPLMSGANAIHGIILIGAILVAAEAKTNFGNYARNSRSCISNNKSGGRLCGNRSHARNV